MCLLSWGLSNTKASYLWGESFDPTLLFWAPECWWFPRFWGHYGPGFSAAAVVWSWLISRPAGVRSRTRVK